MAFKEWSAFGADPIELPINGKVYTIPEIPASVGHQWWLLKEDPEADVPMLHWSQEQQAKVFLGPAYEQMLADDVPASAVARAMLVAQYDWLLGREQAEAIWAAKDASPEALAALLAANLRDRASTSTGADSMTPTPGSTSGTTSPRTTRSTKPAPKAPGTSRGRGSRSGGGSSKRTGPASLDAT